MERGKVPWGSLASWRRSYDVNDQRAQVTTVCWRQADTNEHAFKFLDVMQTAIAQYSDHIRKPGKPLPICANGEKVFNALMSFMDFRTERCDPTIDTIAARCKLSRRTVVRQLDVLRRERVIDWVRRTMKTDNMPGEGPPREQTSNAYFINLARLPIEIMRYLRQKLGDRLREAKSAATGSGPVPSRMAGKAGRLVTNLTGAFATALGQDRADMRKLAGASAEDRLAHMYRDDPQGLREHREMLASGQSASATLALYPSVRTKE